MQLQLQLTLQLTDKCSLTNTFSGTYPLFSVQELMILALPDENWSFFHKRLDWRPGGENTQSTNIVINSAS